MSFIKLTNLDDRLKNHIECECHKIYEEYKNLVYYIAFRIIGIQAVAEEITNDAFLALFKYFDFIRDKKNIKSYLTSTVRRFAYRYIDDIKQDKYTIVHNYDVMNAPDSSDTMFMGWREILSKFKMHLDPDDFDLIIKVVVFGYTIPEIAEETNENQSTIATRVRRIKIKLRKLYKRREDFL